MYLKITRVLTLSLFMFSAINGMAQQKVDSTAVLREKITQIVFDSLEAVNAIISSEANSQIMNFINDGVDRIEKDGLSNTNVAKALEGASEFVHRLIIQARRDRGDNEVHLGETTAFIMRAICPIYPFC